MIRDWHIVCEEYVHTVGQIDGSPVLVPVTINTIRARSIQRVCVALLPKGAASATPGEKAAHSAYLFQQTRQHIITCSFGMVHKNACRQVPSPKIPLQRSFCSVAPYATNPMVHDHHCRLHLLGPIISRGKQADRVSRSSTSRFLLPYRILLVHSYAKASCIVLGACAEQHSGLHLDSRVDKKARQLRPASSADPLAKPLPGLPGKALRSRRNGQARSLDRVQETLLNNGRLKEANTANTDIYSDEEKTRETNSRNYTDRSTDIVRSMLHSQHVSKRG